MKKLSPLSYMSIYDVIGLIFSIFFLWLFKEIAESISHRNIIVAVDQWIIRNVLSIRNEHLTALMKIVTNLGGIIIIGPGTLIIVAYLLLKKDIHNAASLSIAVTGGIILNNLLKLFFQRPRPISETTLAEISGWSFPSGHSMNSIIFYGMLAYVLTKFLVTWQLRIFMLIATFLIIFIIGISRIYLQVHYLSDVIAGFSCGLFWLSVCITGLEIDRKRRSFNG
jgi:membrane-associated phospholipid phosphatase